SITSIRSRKVKESSSAPTAYTSFSGKDCLINCFKLHWDPIASGSGRTCRWIIIVLHVSIACIILFCVTGSTPFYSLFYYLTSIKTATTYWSHVIKRQENFNAGYRYTYRTFYCYVCLL